MVQHLERPPTPGRNDPCPCGSGKKYKRCCLLQEVRTPVPRIEDVLRDVQAADLAGDRDAGTRLLENARADLREPELEQLLAERYLELPADESEELLREWWEQEHDRYSGTALARILIGSDRKQRALEVLQDSQSVETPNEYWRLLGCLREERGEVDAAVAAMELYTRLAPTDAEAWMTLADMQHRAGQAERALQSLRRSADSAPGLIRPRLARLKILAEEDRWRDARDMAEALLEGAFEDATDSDIVEIRGLLARAYFLIGDFESARRAWERLLLDQPENRELRFELASLELTTGRYGRVLELLGPLRQAGYDLLVLDACFRSHLALNELDEAEDVARAIEDLDPRVQIVPLAQAARAAGSKEHSWAADLLTSDPPDPYHDLWLNLRLDCLAHLGQWQEMWPVLRGINHPDDVVFRRAALAAMAAGKLDVVDRLLAKIEDQQALEARALSALVGPVRQSRRAAETRRQQQVDQAEKQRWALEARDLRRRIRDLEQHNAALIDELSLSEQSLERLLQRVGVLADDSGRNWEVHVQELAQRVHKDALAQELEEAEQRLMSMLGASCWSRLSESSRAALREGEWLYAAVEGEDRDYGAALLEFARGLERAYKDVIFVPIRSDWNEFPGAIDRLHDEGHDPSLGPFVRYLLQGTHLTLGSMAASLDRMSDVRRQGVAVLLLRRQLGIDGSDERTLGDWKRVAERLSEAANARNRPAHASSVSRESVNAFREMVLGAGGLLGALDRR